MLFSLSRKAFVMCYCFREPIKTLFFDSCQMTVKSIARLVSGPPNRKTPYNKHLISLVFSVRTVNYGSSFFFPSIYGPSAKTRLIRSIYSSAINHCAGKV